MFTVLERISVDLDIGTVRAAWREDQGAPDTIEQGDDNGS